MDMRDVVKKEYFLIPGKTFIGIKITAILLPIKVFLKTNNL